LPIFGFERIDMNVATILNVKGRNIISALPSDSIAKVAGILAENGIGALLIVDEGGNLKGLLSERDIVRGMATSGDGCLKLLAESLMTSTLVTCGLNDTVNQVMAMMTNKRIRHLPVMENDSLVGFISIGDVVKNRMDEIENEAAAMRDYIATG
jgi:CBS domain-containing protein